ncbi:MAG: protein jag [Anaerolineae bacterium]|nr:protein jag [Anaerolineae bacterium]
MNERSERRSVVASGKTVEDAITNGLRMLGARRDQVDVDVITEGSRGVLGFGAENAQVRLTVKTPPAPAPPVAAPPAPAPATVAEPAPAPAPASVAGAELDPREVGRELLAEILQLMGIQAVVEVQAGEDLADEDQEPPIVLNITGEDLGILIGRRGETLRALQYLLRLMASHRLKQWTNLVVDVENYLVRRRHSLQTLAERVAEQAVRTGRTQAMEPMPAYERRLVHIALRNHPRVKTQSVGEGEKRKVTIVPKK